MWKCHLDLESSYRKEVAKVKVKESKKLTASEFQKFNSHTI